MRPRGELDPVERVLAEIAEITTLPCDGVGGRVGRLAADGDLLRADAPAVTACPGARLGDRRGPRRRRARAGRRGACRRRRRDDACRRTWLIEPMKSATKRVFGIFVDFGRRADLADAALVHDGDAGGERHRLFLVVGDDDEGDAGLVLDVHELELGVLAQLLVERAERLVEQQQLRLLGERAGERDALALAAGELMRLAAGERRRAARGRASRLTRSLRCGVGHRLVLQAVADILLDRHVREERVGLEHHVDRPLVGRHARSCPGRR